MPPASNQPIPETHEKIRDEDIQETLSIFAEGNSVLPRLSEEQHAWLQTALAERQHLCANQYVDGTCDPAVSNRIHELDQMINSVCPEILKVLHFLSRIRAILPVLMQLKEKLQHPVEDPNQQMVNQMQYQCSMAEVKAAIEGLAAVRVRPRILEDFEP